MIVGSPLLVFLLFATNVGSNRCLAQPTEPKYSTSLQNEKVFAFDDQLPQVSSIDVYNGDKVKQRKLRYKGANGNVDNTYKLRDTSSIVQRRASRASRSLKSVNPPKSPNKPSFKVAQQYESVTIRDDFATGGYAPVPPDPIGAASLTTLVAVTNTMIEIQTKLGEILYRESLYTFFASLKNDGPIATLTIGDPKVLYDEYEDRFVIVMLYFVFPPAAGSGGEDGERNRRYLDISDTNQTLTNASSTIFLAVSKDGSPAGPDDWHLQSIDSVIFLTSPLDANTSEYTWADYPGFKLGPEALYLTTNRYGFFSFNYYGSIFYIIAKDSFYGGGKVSYSVHDPFNGKNPLGLTATPAYIHGGSVGNGIGTFLVSYDGHLDMANNSIAYVITVSDPLGSPRFESTSLNLGLIDSSDATQDSLPSPPQLDHGELDRGALDAVWRKGKLWMTTTIFPPSGPNFNQTTAYWVEIDTTGSALFVVDQGEIGGEDLGVGTNTFFPSVAVNTRGVVAFGFAASGPSLYIGAYVVGHMPNDPPGTVSKSFVVHEGIDSYNRTNGGSNNRWGDYTGAVRDPSDDSFWIYNEYADKRGVILGSKYPNQDGAWATAWRRFLTTSCSDDNTGKFYVPQLKSYKNCAWLKQTGTGGVFGGGGGKKGQPNYKRTFCQPVAKYASVRLLCARTCGVCTA